MSKSLKIKHDNYYAKILNGHKSYKTYAKTFQKIKTEGYHLISVKDLVSIANNGCIDFYRNNRGTGKLLERHIERLVDEFDMKAVGVITMVYDTEAKKLVTVDGSHRMSAFCQLAVDDMLEPYWNEVICVNVVNKEQFFTTYQNINSGIAHSKSNTLQNSDLAYGKMINKLIKLAEAQTGVKDGFAARHYKTVAILLHGVYMHRDVLETYIYDWSYENVWSQNCKAATADFIRPEPLIQNCTINDISCLVDGVCAALMYLDELAIRKKRYEKDLAKNILDSHTRKRQVSDAFPSVLTSTSLIGYLICAGSRSVYRVDNPKDYIEEILKRATRLRKITEMGHTGNAGKVDFSKFLDKSIFGSASKAKGKIRYWPK